MVFFDKMNEGGKDGGMRMTSSGVHALYIGADLGCAPTQTGDSGIIAVGNIGDLTGEG